MPGNATLPAGTTPQSCSFPQLKNRDRPALTGKNERNVSASAALCSSPAWTNALRAGEPYGVWGGWTEAERRHLTATTRAALLPT